MRRFFCGAVVCLVLLAGASALGNPVSSQMLRVHQVPKTTHVQVTYVTVLSDLPGQVLRDGTGLSYSWTALASYSANNGSGVRSMPSQQFCDCNLPVGSHEYVAKLTKTFDADELKATIQVVADYSLPVRKDAGPAPDLMPWYQPEPTELQGLDCTKVCTGTKVGPPDSGGCSIWPASRPPGAPALLLLLGGALLARSLRRRR
jgi:hypothetical protein